MRLALFALFVAACGTAESTTPPAEAPGEPAKEAPVDPATGEMLISGTITAPAEVPAAKAIFVSLRDPARRGPPLAAKRLPAGPFPMEFTVTEADRPMANGDVPATFQLKVTLDIDGNPMAKSPEDLEGVVEGKKGATGVHVALSPRG